jgi:DNA ligase-1
MHNYMGDSMTDFKPMLAKDYDPAKLIYPVYASPKLDGIRCVIVNGRPMSRTLKPIPSKHVQFCLTQERFDGMDGELIVGDATAKNVLNNTTSHVMAHDKVFDFTYYVFDIHDSLNDFDMRLQELMKRVGEEYSGETRPICNIVALNQTVIHNDEELALYEAEQIDLGYEGVILRKIDGEYKFGRSTVNEGLLLKVKRFVDSECVVLGVIEQLKNNNEKIVNELGRSKRSSHQENKVGKGTAGSLYVRDLVTGVEFNIGSGMDANLLQEIWDNREAYINSIVTYKFFPVGVKDLPRHPVFKGFRHKEDM